jgi:hypothetical protein
MRLRDLYRDRAVWLYAVLTAAFFYRPLTTQTFFFRDLYQCFYPRKVILAAALRAGTFPLWDPFTNGGQPYLAMPPYTAFHPSNLLYALLPPIAAFNAILVLHVFLCAVAAYWLARTVGLSRPAAFVTGIAYAFAGVTLSTANLIGWLLALPWVPLTIGLAHRAERDGRSLAPAAIAASMPLFASMPEAAAVLFITLLAWRFRASTAALIIAGAIGLSLVATLPATSVVAQSSRGTIQRTYESFTSWSIHPRRLPELIVPQYLGPTNTLDERDYRGRQWETLGFPLLLSIYFGVPLLLVAAVGACTRNDQVAVPRGALAAVAIIGLLLSLGRYLPGFRLIYDFVPLVTLFRYPSKALVLMLLPVAILAGCGVERVAANRRSALLLAAVVTLDLLSAGWSVNAYAPRAIFDEPPLAAVVRDVIGPLRFYAPPRPLVVRAPTNEIRWLARSQIAALSEQTPVTFGIPVIFHQDYDGLAPRAIAQLARQVPRASWRQAKPLLDAAGVRAFLTPDEVRLPGVVEIARADDLHLYLNRDAYAARFRGNCTGGRARILRRDLNSARYEVDAPCDGIVLFSENHYDGWRATVDGHEVPHVRALGAFTSVAVGKGHHVIERRYFPPRLIAGALGSIVTALLLVIVSRRRDGALVSVQA